MFKLDFMKIIFFFFLFFKNNSLLKLLYPKINNIFIDKINIYIINIKYINRMELEINRIDKRKNNEIRPFSNSILIYIQRYKKINIQQCNSKNIIRIEWCEPYMWNVFFHSFFYVFLIWFLYNFITIRQSLGP